MRYTGFRFVWRSCMLVGLIVVGLLVFAGVSVQASVTLGTLHEGDGAAETLAYCSPCHSVQIVSEQRLSDEDWEAVFRIMEDEHGMAPILEPVRTRILTYLSRHYSNQDAHQDTHHSGNSADER